MIGYLLLLIAIALFFTSKRKWSILLFLIFAMQGLRLLPDELLGSKSQDMAFVYMIIIGTYSAIYEQEDSFYLPYNRNAVWMLILFLFASAAFSLYHYKFSAFQVLQGGRHLFLFASYFFLRKTKPNDIEWILKALFYITALHAGLYIFQCITHLPVLGVPEEEALNKATKIYRYYNYPQLMPFYLLVGMLYPRALNSHVVGTSLFLFIVAILLTQGRTFIVMNALICCLGFLMRGKLTNLVQWALIGSIIALPFVGSVANRFTEDKTESDINTIISGRFLDYAASGKGDRGNLTFRFAWVAERFLYLKDRPNGEKIFGLGMISDSQRDVVNNKYHFIIGLNNEQKETIQLSTGDIAWGNFLTQFGIGGTIILLLLWCSLFGYLLKLRHLNPYLMCGTLYLLFQFLNSIADSHLSDTGNMVFPMLLCTYGLAIYLNYDEGENEEFEMIEDYDPNPH